MTPEGHVAHPDRDAALSTNIFAFTPTPLPTAPLASPSKHG
jgi:hypothetical protein